MQNRASIYGFTLVELAIAMTIIGLLIAGVLKGQQMIQNARITQLVTQVEAFRTATTAFWDKYDALPGDIRQATTRVPGCTGTCVDGNGNSLIGLTPADGFPGFLLFLQPPQSGTAFPQVETSMYFRHLALADLIAGVNPDADPATPAWGETNPSAPFGGGYTVYHEPGGSGGATSPLFGNSGHFLRVVKNMEIGVFGGANSVQPFSQYLAALIDNKVDDGKCVTGSVATLCEPSGSGCSFTPAPSSAQRYDEQQTETICAMYFKLD